MRMYIKPFLQKSYEEILEIISHLSTVVYNVTKKYGLNYYFCKKTVNFISQFTQPVSIIEASCTTFRFSGMSPPCLYTAGNTHPCHEARKPHNFETPDRESLYKCGRGTRSIWYSASRVVSKHRGKWLDDSLSCVAGFKPHRTGLYFGAVFSGLGRCRLGVRFIRQSAKFK